MELPHIGKQCSSAICKKLDFLPITCDACHGTFCDEHYTYQGHNCPKAYLKDNQVPVCPLCNQPVPVSRGQQPDLVVGAHIDNDCQSDPAKNRRKVFTNKCSRKGCKVKEVIPVLCTECTYNFCLKHRHPADHSCEGKAGALRKRQLDAALSRQQNGKTSQSNNTAGNNYISEDEALARALALSMQETSNGGMSQEEIDLALARQLQAMETGAGVPTRSSNSRCRVQ